MTVNPHPPHGGEFGTDSVCCICVLCSERVQEWGHDESFPAAFESTWRCVWKPSKPLSLWWHVRTNDCVLTYYACVSILFFCFYLLLLLSLSPPPSLLPSRCSVAGAGVCPGCWTKTSTSSPSLNSLVMCMLLQLTSSLFILLLFSFSPSSSSPIIRHLTSSRSQ